MPEPVTLVSASLSIAANAWKVGKETYDLVQGVKSAPRHIQRLAADFEGLYGVLGILQGLLESHESRSPSANLPALTGNIETALRGCIRVFQDVQQIITPFVAVNGKVIRSTWNGIKWELFKKNDVNVLQTALDFNKQTLNIACSALVLFHTSSTNDMVEHISKDIRRLKQQADNREREEVMHHLEHQGNSGQDHQQWQSDNRLSIATYNIPMHRFLQRTESLISSSSGASRDASIVVTDLDPIHDNEDSIETTVPIASDELSRDSLSDTEAPKTNKLFGEDTISSNRELDDADMEYHAVSTDTLPILVKGQADGDRMPLTEAASLLPAIEDKSTLTDDPATHVYFRALSYPFYVQLLYDYGDPQDKSDLCLREGEVVQVLARTGIGWYDGLTHDLRRGWFPSTYCDEVLGLADLENVQVWKRSLSNRSGEKSEAPADSTNTATAVSKPPPRIPSSVSLKCEIQLTNGERPPPLAGAPKTILGDTLYIFSGLKCDRPPRTFSRSLWELDLKTLCWTRVYMKGDIPPPRYFHTLCAWGKSKLVCYGGLSPSGLSGSLNDEEDAVVEGAKVTVMSDIHVFDTTTLNWTELVYPKLFNGRYAHLATVLEKLPNDPAELPPPQVIPSGSPPKPFPAKTREQGDMGDRGDELVVVGGQDVDNKYIAYGGVFNMQDLKKCEPGEFLEGRYGSYGGFMASLNPTVAENIKTKAPQRDYSAGKRSGLARSCALLFKNENFLDPTISLKARFADGTWTENLTSVDGPRKGLSFRFPNGGVMGSFLVVCGFYMTTKLSKFGISIFDLRSLTWAGLRSPGEPNDLNFSLQKIATLAEGSWNGGLVWASGNALVLLGDKKGDQLDDYNRRRATFAEIAVIRLDDGWI